MGDSKDYDEKRTTIVVDVNVPNSPKVPKKTEPLGAPILVAVCVT